MAVRNTALLPQTLFHGTRSLHSGMAGKGLEDVTRRADGIVGGKFGTLVSSSFPMPDGVQIMLEGNMAATSGGSKEPTTKANSASPNVSSEDSTERGQKVAETLFVLYVFSSAVYVLVLFGSFVYNDLKSQKEEMTLESTDDFVYLQKQKELLAENDEMIGRIAEQKKRIQELAAPMFEWISSIAARMLLGSALAFGVTAIMFVIERYK